ncbi:Crp/Fnr family transcriptional regulator [Aidingimonas halophila]|uniref:cAMP-binding domain of CRP or a regulatory subunit of cAMP-dependent protein kinases n=1 Tax=Aidingimonas halophila TaxID=574349 RepID=A0A1H2UT93_9GAMM|nr:Crp/Fnr family transcriptional regulator [Aidingimonas halophila]GHC23089.1 Crp/Fnr family transcriptional regulator [Aidingimonas halophila]SDW58819.1 cAMP-binding domain of CRP or a regulatory subunit of cAMP-dependent protein kinases [Aidingimonas halophila]
MSPFPAFPAANRLLQELPAVEHAAFMAACEPVNLVFGKVLVEPGALIEQVYFPLDGFISLIVSLDDGDRLEVAMAGREGMMGVSLLLGVEESPLCALVQGAGMALRMDAARFRSLLSSCPVLQQRLQRYLYVVIGQLARTAACTHFHQVEARLARWLLMTQDRADSDKLYLTHEFLAAMLGVRRAGITQAATALQERALISYRRGNITVLDRPGLIDVSCGCYRADCSLYSRILDDHR